MPRLKLGVLVSGNGSNLQAILDATRRGTLAADVCVVISNKADAFALERARTANVPTVALAHGAFADREQFDHAVVSELRRHSVEWVVLAGFMRMLTSVFLNAYPDRVINIHPSLLPAFPGVAAQKQALEYGVKVTGCSVHFVESGMDTGPIIAQRTLAVEPDDDEDRLRDRLLVVEHALLLDVLAKIADNKVHLSPDAPGRRRVSVG